MNITVKELIKDQLDWADDSGKYGDLTFPVILESYKEIFENILETYKKELDELKQQILYKEDFWPQSYCINCEKVDRCILSSCSENTWRNNYVLKENYVLKHNPKYDKLPNKEEK
ncbi:hypothetical protein [Spiroplasma phoeniceum]|uniref:Uncharacterized protein n=1 Tax=Spiroplasma phoeniceum P40 TaxID=1276259 RepID=A0A345DLK4_9MOLU|nr:hypothetical protein [Spiroplasma phoeniceum]AXF95092.1 hypothetical protein SDAV_0076 [Spiroplasma phoeniceum P40]AXF96199.1 hypothetical protein SDAV_001232 [Spiroplasma phoeniceum P40]